jgi:hypothetical protein
MRRPSEVPTGVYVDHSAMAALRRAGGLAEIIRAGAAA